MRLVKDGGKPRELYFASDANAVVEHTKKVMMVEDNEVVHIRVSVILLCIPIYAPGASLPTLKFYST